MGRPLLSPSRFLALSPPPCRTSWKCLSFLSPRSLPGAFTSSLAHSAEGSFASVSSRRTDFLRRLCRPKSDENVDKGLVCRLLGRLLHSFGDSLVAQESHDPHTSIVNHTPRRSRPAKVNPRCSISATKLTKSQGQSRMLL